MPNGNLTKEIECPLCKEKRQVRTDVIKRVLAAGRELICKPCNNRIRFAEKNHPRKGTGVKNDAALLYTRSSFYKAKQRVKLGSKHHPCYENVEFRFESLQELIDEIGLRPKGHTLDRINTLGHYEKGNVRWATIAEQAKNRMPRNYWKVVRSQHLNSNEPKGIA